ncbi:precorrin-6A synthase (deacetylating) [Rhodococcus rhodochrous J3]|uniref:Precorrin-6A synthase (Deacetylating) n=2 Tax=Rhodococcus rhodochrous TaxID=1829 RepID=A0AA46WTP2_RHORH|nr:precorrin-6A synthase (deacetylating) [Rhodococcus rhodochrous]MBF4479469.1 precorrin-6A synthase (deacetylating) [Rhodococcus rhodochrous]MCB8909964.1 precorrin-6A synthase (deacetylating) [Rhodococcus rhodochrous]MDJ0399019.1 precorrin-6A synthase (deacetylating) [Rhodococcus rhodochrous]MDO1486036.1 precorrin-6A synthase (deacetylating) [Rhodococcus rhodochrous]UZF44186.1 precorrin-6A synthase (deacetylating) [Rhodococcus rhodochrous]
MRVRLIGIGPGGPDDLTVAAVRALESVDVFLVPDKKRGVDDLVAVREEILRRHTSGSYRMVVVPDPPRDRNPERYGDEVRDWHAARAEAYETVLLEQVREDETVGFLVWGDPSLYDSTIRVVERILERGRVWFDYDVVPGISSVQLLAARHRLVLNTIGGPITVTTGRRLLRDVAAGASNIVVMLDGGLACADLDGTWSMWWGANLGTDDEELVAGKLAEVLPAIREARARAKQARGWVMDTYLLRRG